jgi:hypothetical protein
MLTATMKFAAGAGLNFAKVKSEISAPGNISIY